MDNQLQKQETNISTQTFDERALPVVAKISLLGAYPMSAEETKVWTAMIYKIVPDVTVEELKTVIEGFMTGRYDYENKIGIRNVFNAIKLLRNGDQPISYFELP